MISKLFRRFQKSLKQLADLGLVRLWMRLGYAAKGIIYLMIGLLALGEAGGLSLPLLGTEGILIRMTQQPLGIAIVLLLAIGIAGYAFWRFVQAVVDPEHDDSQSPLRLAQRMGYASSSFSYASVSYGAIKFITDVQAEQDDAIEDLTAQLLESAWGISLLLLAGLMVIGIGLIYIYGGLSEAYISQFKASCYGQVTELATRLGQVGYVARGVAFTAIGGGLIQAVWLSQSEQAGGLQNAFQKIEGEPYGRLGLGLIAAGFVAYAMYAFLVAVYRRFDLR